MPCRLAGWVVEGVAGHVGRWELTDQASIGATGITRALRRAARVRHAGQLLASGDRRMSRWALVVGGDRAPRPRGDWQRPAGEEGADDRLERGRLVLVEVVPGPPEVDQLGEGQGLAVVERAGPGQVVAGPLDDQRRGRQAGQRGSRVRLGPGGGRLGELVGVEAQPVQRRPRRSTLAVQRRSAVVVDPVVAGVHLGVTHEGVRRPRVDLQQGEQPRPPTPRETAGRADMAAAPTRATIPAMAAATTTRGTRSSAHALLATVRPVRGLPG
jgi:hypothetical protein